MRTVPFREVLHGVAYKMGLDPDQSNFLTNQAVPIGTYVDEWIRRTYDSKDWPEWVVTHKFAPSSHVVPWDAVAIDLVIPPSVVGTTVQIGRVIKVYLVDPSTTDAPIDTPFTLRDNGIHVGYEHGQYVWIRFIAPAPRYTAVQWRPDTTFQKDDVTYSYTTGQVYRSKSNGNIGHDPSGTFQAPPVPHVIEPMPPSPAPDVVTTQVSVPYNSGGAVRNKILRIYLLGTQPPPDPPDPPLAGSTWEFSATDNAGATIGGGTFSFVASGTDSLSDVLDGIYADLTTGAPVGWIISKDNTELTLTIEAPSDFRFLGFASAYARWSNPDGIPIAKLRTVELQSYIPAITTSSGQPQITRVTMTDGSTTPGSVYKLTVTDSTGGLHTVTYASQLYDSATQILQGLLLAAETAATSTDTYWTTVAFTLDPSAVTLDLSIRETFSVDATAPPPGSSWWELVPFPRELSDQVMRGAYGDLLKEWAQTDKGLAEEQMVPQESAIAEGKFTSMPTPPLIGQQTPASRYRVQ